jgi:predicted nucleic acid-binding protein
MMVLVDTSVWVDHLRTGDAVLASLLQAGLVCCHPMIVGELACGSLQNRKQILGLLSSLPACVEATHDEALQLIDRHGLMGKGIGFVDVHLLTSCLLTGETQLWTRDKRLAGIAQTLGLSYVETH